MLPGKHLLLGFFLFSLGGLFLELRDLEYG